MKTNNVVNNVVVKSLVSDILEKKTTGTSNGKINFVCGKVDAFSVTSYGNEKDGRKFIEGIIKGTSYLSPSQRFAFEKMNRAQEEFNRQISSYVNRTFEADKIVSYLINEMAKTDGAEFFTPDFLRKYDLYKIPCGVILDTLQRCKSFVSSLYAAAFKAYQDEIKAGNGIETAVTLCRKQISLHNNSWMSTKWDVMSDLNKMRVLAPVIFWNWYPLKGQAIPDNAVRYTHGEQVEILRRLGVKVRLKGRKTQNVASSLIEIEEYKVKRFGEKPNFYHHYAENAKALSEEEKAKVMSAPVTLLSENVTKRTKTTK